MKIKEAIILLIIFISKFAYSLNSDNNNIQFNWPIKDYDKKILVTSPFSIRWGQLHKGIDISTSTGEKIYPAYKGKILFAGKFKGYGNLIIISHGDKYKTLYAHLSSISVKKGMNVNEKTLIGKSGVSGTLTGPNLHFEIQKYNVPVDPLSKLPKNYKIMPANRSEYIKIHNS